MMDRFTVQLSSLKLVSAPIPICSFLYLSVSHSRLFIIVFKIQKKNRISQNEQQKITHFERKTGIQKEKISKYFEELVIQVHFAAVCYSESLCVSKGDHFFGPFCDILQLGCLWAKLTIRVGERFTMNLPVGKVEGVPRTHRCYLTNQSLNFRLHNHFSVI